jgi:putative transposase
MHAFHEIFLHFTWHCFGDQPLIQPPLEPELHRFIEEYCRKLPGVFFKRVGGTETHVHLVVQLAPTECPSEIVGKIKGASAHEMNRWRAQRDFRWQGGYGVVSFAKRNLGALIRYVDNQKAHHAAGTINEALERVAEDARAEATG